MKNGSSAVRVFVVTIALLAAFGSAAHAQATRTWVSGVGDDVNPCSRTAPCKTFAGAISKTAAGGVINVLDPGSYGALTITKSITVQNEGSFAGVIHSGGGNGFTINAGATDVVVIRGLSFEGLGSAAIPGNTAIRFLNGLSLTVENCDLNRGFQKGIDFAPSGNSQLFVKDTVIRNFNFASGGGIHIHPGAAGSAQVILDNVRVERNAFGVRAEDRSRVSISRSEIGRNSADGVLAISTAGGAVDVNVTDSTMSFNLGGGVKAEGGAQAIVRINRATIVGNGTGIATATGGVVKSFGNNANAGNTVDGAPTAPNLTQQ